MNTLDRFVDIHLKATTPQSRLLENRQVEENLQRWKCDLDFDVDVWYSYVRPYTFPTILVDVDIDDMLGAMASSQHQKNKIIELLQERMKSATADGTTCSSFFVRLASRSPKDVVTDRSRSHLQSLLLFNSDALAAKNPADQQNNEFLYYFISQIESMQVKTAAEAVGLVCESTRTVEDVKRLHALGSPSVRFALRQWDPTLHLCGEFRCFVTQKRLVAISQYYCDVFIPALNTAGGKCKQHVLSVLVKAWEMFRIRVPYESYVIDLGIRFPTKNLDDVLYDEKLWLARKMDDVVIVEFNPYNSYTSPSLFSWVKDATLLGKQYQHTSWATTATSYLPIDETIGKVELRVRDTYHPAPTTSQSTGGGGRGFETDMMMMDPALMEQYGASLSMAQEVRSDDYQRILSRLQVLNAGHHMEGVVQRI